ncbi:MAG: hypothetical protein JF588_11445 [Caulobacterales bacterium]|nr:hypothetical protein [Caulobacterales bacterium]
MSSDPTYNVKVRFLQGGDVLDVAPGGKITADGAQATLTAVAATAATNTSPYGFAQAQADAIVTQLNLVIAALKALGVST